MSMIRLVSSGAEKWISPTFSHPLILGAGPDYIFNHMMGRAPDKHLIQYYNGNNVWSEVYDSWQNSVGTSFYGFSVNSNNTDANSSHIRIDRFAAGDYRAVLLWF